MNLLPASASITSHSNIADLFTKPLSRHRFDILIGDATTTITSTTSVAPTLVASTAPVNSLALAVDTLSDSVPTLHPTSVPLVLDTGASRPVPQPFSDFALEVTKASYGLFRSPISDVSKALASTPVDPYTLITGEDTATVDLSSPDTVDFDSDSGPSFTKVSFDICEFGTATLTFIYSKSSSELLHIFVDPTQVDWLHWIPLPRLTPTESYFHICGRDYLQAFALFHLIPIWIALVSALLRSE